MESLKYDSMFQRNIGVVTEEQQEMIRNAGVSVIGLGGQSLNAILAVKAGFGKVKGADRDVFEYTNLNRQLLATVDAIGRKKSDIAQEVLEAHNPNAEIDCRFMNVQTVEQAKEILKDTDFFMVAVDCPYSRVVMTRAADELKIPYVVCAPIGWKLFMATFIPGGPTYEEYTFQPSLGKKLTEDLMLTMLNHQRCFYACSGGFFSEYVEDQIRNKINFNSMFFTSNFLSALCVGEIVKLATKQGDVRVVPDIYTIDLLNGKEWNYQEVGIKCVQMREILEKEGVEAAIEYWKSIK